MQGDELLEAGFAFETVEYRVERAFQEAKLRAAGIDPARYGGLADPTFLGHGALKAMHVSGISLLGQVHVTQRFRLHRALRLEEPLTVTGMVTQVEAVPRGRRVSCRFGYRDREGREVCRTERSGLRPDPAGRRGRGGGATVPEEDGFEQIAEHRLTPEGVAAYSDDTLNAIHNDPEVAARYGFRAPIAAGLMGIHYYIAALAGDGMPERLDLAIRFLRPMFWDDRLGLQRRDARMRLVNPDGKPVSEAVFSLPKAVGSSSNGV